MAGKDKGGKKDAKPAKSEGGGGSKQKKKKWSKGKTREKLNNLVFFDKATYDRFVKEVPGYKLITPSVVSERLKVRGSLARAALRELHRKGLIKLISKHSSQDIYTRAVEEQPKEETAQQEKAPKQTKAQKAAKAKEAKAAAAAEEEA